RRGGALRRAGAGPGRQARVGLGRAAQLRRGRDHGLHGGRRDRPGRVSLDGTGGIGPVAGTTPYPWPWDGGGPGWRLGRVGAGWDAGGRSRVSAGSLGAVDAAVVGLAEAVAGAGGAVV